jgi:CO/xanthine dehydrogenase FAD-binding subunit
LPASRSPLRATDTEYALESGVDAAEVAELATDPVSDVHTDGGYGRRVATVPVGRAIEEAAARCG